jgi:hypothetical protein
MPRTTEPGAWPYRGFTVRYHRLAGLETVNGFPTLWWAEVLDAPTIPPLGSETLAGAQVAVERAIDALLNQQHSPPPPARVRTAPRARYHPLYRYLALRPVTERQVILSFEEVERLIGKSLSHAARTNTSYWTSLVRRVRRWQMLGWHARLDSVRQAVVFTRV